MSCQLSLSQYSLSKPKSYSFDRLKRQLFSLTNLCNKNHDFSCDSAKDDYREDADSRKQSLHQIHPHEVDPNEVFSDKYTKVCKFTLKVMGLWPYQSRCINFFARTFYLLATVTMMIPQIIRGFQEIGGNSFIILETIAGFLFFSVSLIKYTTNFQNIHKLQYLYEQSTKHINEFIDEEEHNILRKFAKDGQFLIIGYIAFVTFVSVSIPTVLTVAPVILDAVNPLNTTRRRRLCYSAEYFIDQDKYHNYLLLHTTVGAIGSLAIHSTIDSTYACIGQHSIALFKITDYRLQKALELIKNKSNFEPEVLKINIHNYVISAVTVHKKSIEFVDLLQTTYSTSFFVSTLAILLGLCVGCAMMIMRIDDIFDAIRIYMLWFFAFINLFYISLPGQKIYDYSSQIYQSIYFSGWYQFPLQTQNLLKFMMLRCYKPCQLKAGPLLIMNLETFGNVVKTAMSYVAVVLSMS